MQQLGRKGVLGNEIVEELHTLESNQVSAVNDLIEAMAGTKFYKENFQQALRQKRLSGEKVSAEEWNRLQAMQTGEDILSAKGGVDPQVVVRNTLLAEQLRGALTGKDFMKVYMDPTTKKVFDYYVANPGEKPWMASLGRIGQNMEELDKLLAGKWRTTQRTATSTAVKKQNTVDRIEDLLEGITRQYKTSVSRIPEEASSISQNNSVVEGVHTEAFAKVANYMANTKIPVKQRERLVKALKRQRTLYFKSSNNYAKKLEQDIEEIFEKSKKELSMDPKATFQIRRATAAGRTPEEIKSIREGVLSERNVRAVMPGRHRGN